jgi:uncharacterized membrane protein
LLASFSCTPKLEPVGDLSGDVVDRYQAEWRLLAPAIGKKGRAIDPRVAELMQRSALDGEAAKSRLGRLLFPGKDGLHDTAIVGALTLSDIVYSAASIDPTVIKAADFTRADVLDDPLAFADFARKIHEMSPTAYTGAISNIKGYVAEQVVAAELIAQGHQVSFPEVSNEAGWDLLVDGKEFQVKCLYDTGGLAAHFGKYDYPVLANVELAEKIPPEWADKVFFVEGYNNELVTHVTEISVKAGANVFSPDVPVFTFAVSAVRNLLGYQAGKVSTMQAVEQIILDGSTRIGLAVAGGYAGSAIGLLVFGPAGALVLGATVPVLSQAQASSITGALDKLVRGDDYKQWAEEINQAVDASVACLEQAIEDKRQILRSKYGALGSGGVSDYVRARIEDDARFLRESLALLKHLNQQHWDAAEQRALAVIRWAGSSTIHPACYQSELVAMDNALKKPLITEFLDGKAKDLVDLVIDLGRSFIAGVQAGWKDRKR